MTSTSGMAATALNASVAGENALPCRAVTFSCGSKLVNDDLMTSWKPLKMDIVITIAIVANASPQTEMSEMMLMALCLFLEKM